jgi:hypothetical protein
MLNSQKATETRTTNSEYLTTTMRRFLFLQLTSWIFLAYLFVAQVIPVFDYDIGIAMKTQESIQEVGPIGVAFYKGFAASDALVYLPLMAAGLLLHLAGGHEEPSKLLLGAAYGITIYWPVDCLAALEAARGHWNLPKEAEDEYGMALPVIAFWGFICLVLLLRPAAMTASEIMGVSSYWEGPGLLWTICLWSGVLSPFLYLCNDMMECALHYPSHPWQSTTISELAAPDQAHYLSMYLLLISAVSLFLFGFGVVCHVDRVMGTLQLLIGICNILTASQFRLANSIDDLAPFESLPLQSKIHIALVGMAVVLSASTLIYDMFRARPSWAPVTGGLGLIVMIGVVGASTHNLQITDGEDHGSWFGLGVMERLSVYSIQLWTFMFAVDSVYITHFHPSHQRRPKDKVC